MKVLACTLALAFMVVTSCVTILAFQPSERNSKPRKNGEEKSSVTYPLEGIWEQRFAFKGRWTGVIKVEVTHNGDSYSMVLADRLEDDGLISSLGISNVNHVIDTWTFDSNWGSYGIGNFVLQRQSDDRYAGYSYQDGLQLTVNEWVRIAKPLEGEWTTGNKESIKVYESATSWLIVGKGKNPNASLKATGYQYASPVLRLHSKVADRPNGSDSNLPAIWEIPKTEVPDLTATRIELNSKPQR